MPTAAMVRMCAREVLPYMAKRTISAQVLSSPPDQNQENRIETPEQSTPKKKRGGAPKGKNQGKPRGKTPDGAMYLRAFTHDAYRCLGQNYLIRKWLPKKGPYFVALVQAMRAHIYWAFESGQQETMFVPEAATIAEWAGMSRSKVFDLLNDPDMEQFVYRVNRRRWDEAEVKEVQTSNIYYVMMEDPPLGERDAGKVQRAQERITVMEALKAGQMSMRDAQRVLEALDARDAEVRAEEEAEKPRGKRHQQPNVSESTKTTQTAVVINDSDSSRCERLEDRMSIKQFLGEDTSICKGVEAGAIRNAVESATGRRTKDEDGADQIGESRAKRIESDRVVLAAPAAPPPALPSAGVLTEGEAWKCDARATLDATRNPTTKRTVLEHHLHHFGADDLSRAVEGILSHYVPYRVPAAMLADLAGIARQVTEQHVAQTVTDPSTGEVTSKVPNPGGYYITVMNSLASKAKAARYNIEAVKKLVSKAERKANPVASTRPVTPTPSQGFIPRAQRPTRAGTARAWEPSDPAREVYKGVR
jgi:hypothetical protein